MEVNHEECILKPKGKPSIKVPYDKNTFLPVMQCFNNALEVAENLALEGSDVSQGNTNLTYLQKLLLKWHIWAIWGSGMCNILLEMVG